MKISNIVAFLVLAQNNAGVDSFLVPNKLKRISFTTSSSVLQMGVPKPAESAYASILAKLEKAGEDMKQAISSRLSAVIENVEQTEIETKLEASIEEVKEAIADVEGAVGSTTDSIVANAENELETAMKDIEEAVETDNLNLLEKAEKELEEAIVDVEKAVDTTDASIEASSSENIVLEASSPGPAKSSPEQVVENAIVEVDEVKVSTTTSSESATMPNTDSVKELEPAVVASAQSSNPLEEIVSKTDIIEKTVEEKAAPTEVAQIDVEIEKSNEIAKANPKPNIEAIVEEKAASVESAQIDAKVEKSTETITTTAKTVASSADSSNAVKESLGGDAEHALASATTDVLEASSAVVEKTINEVVDGNSIMDSIVSSDAANTILEAGEAIINTMSSLQ